MDFDLMDIYEIVDDILIFGGIALFVFGQWWGLLLVPLGIGWMAMKGELQFGESDKNKQLTEEERKYFEYTGEAENEYEGDDEDGDSDGD